VVISKIRVAPVDREDVLKPAVTAFSFRSHANDIAGRRCCGCDVGAAGAMEYEGVLKHDFLRERAW